MDAFQIRVPLKHREYQSNEWSNLPLPTVSASGGGSSLTISGYHEDAVDGKPIVIQIDSDGDGTEGSGGATFLWKLAGVVQGSGLETSSATTLGTTGLTLDFPDSGMNSTHSWYFTCQKLDLVGASPSNDDGTHYGARILKCVAGGGGIRVDMAGGDDCSLTMAEGEEILGEFLRIVDISNTITNLRVSW